MRLTDFGKRTLSVVALVMLAMVFLTGSVICLCEYSYWLGIGQKAYNVLFICMVMPMCVAGSVKLICRNRGM